MNSIGDYWLDTLVWQRVSYESYFQVVIAGTDSLTQTRVMGCQYHIHTYLNAET